MTLVNKVMLILGWLLVGTLIAWPFTALLGWIFFGYTAGQDMVDRYFVSFFLGFVLFFPLGFLTDELEEG